MLSDLELEKHVQDLLIDICAVMHSHGYEMVSIGAIMRLIGVGEDRARQHDQEYFALDTQFEKLLQAKNQPPAPKTTPNGVTVH